MNIDSETISRITLAQLSLTTTSLTPSGQLEVPTNLIPEIVQQSNGDTANGQNIHNEFLITLVANGTNTNNAPASNTSSNNMA